MADSFARSCPQERRIVIVPVKPSGRHGQARMSAPHREELPVFDTFAFLKAHVRNVHIPSLAMSAARAKRARPGLLKAIARAA
jgi:hypothetical protein